MSLILNERFRLDWNWSNFLNEDIAPVLVDVITNERLCTLSGHSDHIRGGKMLGDSRLLTWSNDKTLRVWELSGQCLSTLRHDGPVYDALVINEEHILSSSGEHSINLWRWTDEHCIASTAIPFASRCGPLRVCFANKDIAVVAGDQIIVGIRADRGEVLFEIKTESYFPKIAQLDDTYFVVQDYQTVQLMRIDTGDVINTFCVSDNKLRQMTYAMIPLPEGRILISSTDLSKKNTVFFLWDAIAGRKLGKVSLSGEQPVSLNLDEDGNSVLVPLYDYRVLSLSLSPLKIEEVKGIPPVLSDGFDSFIPANAIKKSNAKKRLNVHWLGEKSALALSFKDSQERMNTPQCGLVSKEKYAIRLDDEWRIYETSSIEYEVYSDSLMQAYYPEFIKKMIWEGCLNHDIGSLVLHMANAHGLPIVDINEAISRPPEQNTHYSSMILNAENGLYMTYPKEAKIWRFDPQSLKYELIVNNKPNAFVNNELIIDSNGALQCWSDKGITPLLCDEKNAPLLVPKAMYGSTSLNLLLPNKHFLFCNGKNIDVHSAEDGTKITQLPAGHGHAHWGIRKLSNGPIATWSRISLRSWEPESYKPLVEIQDAVDWGPGSESVLSQNDKIIYQLGTWGCDLRVVVWDGKYDITVYGGHKNTVEEARMLAPGVMMSYAGGNSSNDHELHFWRLN